MRASQSSSAGFTLIELLTVIAIIGILAAIILPTVARVRQSARSAQCLSNLRQIGMGIIMYTEDNKGKFPYGYAAGGTYWNMSINSWLGSWEGKRRASDIFFCTAESQKLPDTADHNRTNYIGNDRIMIDNQKYDTPRKLSDIPQPYSQKVIVADGTVNTNGLCDWGFYNDKASTVSGVSKADEAVPDQTVDGVARISWRHNGKTQAVFLDGHAKSFAVGELKYKNTQIGY